MLCDVNHTSIPAYTLRLVSGIVLYVTCPNDADCALASSLSLQ
jgi:hypothetical protein